MIENINLVRNFPMNIQTPNIQNKFEVEMRKRKPMQHREYRRCWRLLLIRSMKKIEKKSIERMPLLVGIGMIPDLHCPSMMEKKLHDTIYSMR